MSRQEYVPTSFDMVAQMWVWPAVMSNLFIRTLDPLQTERPSKPHKLGPRETRARRDRSRLTPKEEFLLLHLLD